MVSSYDLQTLCRLDRAEILSLLPIYRPEHVYIDSAEFDGEALTVLLRRFDYPYTGPALDYLPGTYAVLFVCQAAYLLGASVVRWTGLTDMSMDEYLDLMMAEQMVFSGFTFDFQEFVANDGRAQLEIAVGHLKEVRRKLLVRMGFRVGEAMQGTCSILVARDRSIRRPWAEQSAAHQREVGR